MTRGSKDKYTGRQKADEFEEGFVKKSVSETEAEKRVWATLKKESAESNKSGSGREQTGSAADRR